jgi:disease resistance protein RPM1
VFTYKLEDKHGGFAAKMKKRIKHAKAWWRLAHKLQDIKGRLRGAMTEKSSALEAVLVMQTYQSSIAFY